MPTINSTSYQTINNDPKEDKLFEKRPTINWDVVEPLLKKAQNETGDKYTAVYGVRKDKSYQYQISALQFSEEALKDANGKLRPYFFQSYSNINSPREILAAYIPDSKQAIAEMEAWILSKVPSEAVSKSRSDLQSPGKSSGNQISADCFVPDYTYMMGHTMVIVGHTEPCITASPDGGSGGGGASDGSSGGDVNCHKQLLPTEDCPGVGDGQCPPPNLCGGTGGGGDGGLNAMFLGDIIVDNSITRNDLTDCVYGKLDNTDIFTDLIAKFEGGSSTFDLKFELAEIPNDDPGNLKGEGANDFVAQIDASQLSTRSGLAVAGTFLHEAMHAEMRRYLYDKQEEGSTIPGFPGSFTEDWNNYVKQKTGGVGATEHRAMAKYFIGYIADGLQEYDNNQLSRAHYEAIAWDGLRRTDAWNAVENKSEIWEYRQDDKIEKRPQQCSR